MAHLQILRVRFSKEILVLIETGPQQLYYYYYCYYYYSGLWVIWWRLVIPDLNQRSKRFTPAIHEQFVLGLLVWSSVALWLATTEGSYLILVIIILVITFIQCIYNYIPETNHVYRVYVVATVLYLQFVLHVILFPPWNMFSTFTLALSAVCVQCPI